MLAPALTKAMDAAKLTHCKNNYKQLYIGVIMYTDNSKGNLPAGGDASGASNSRTYQIRNDRTGYQDDPMGISLLFSSNTLGTDSMKATLCPSWNSSNGAYSIYITRGKDYIEADSSFENMTSRYAGYTVAYYISPHFSFTASRLNDPVFNTKPVFMMDIMSDFSHTSDLSSTLVGYTHKFEENNLTYIDGSVRSFPVYYLNSVNTGHNDTVENFTFQKHIWDYTKDL